MSATLVAGCFKPIRSCKGDLKDHGRVGRRRFMIHAQNGARTSDGHVSVENRPAGPLQTTPAMWTLIVIQARLSRHIHYCQPCIFQHQMRLITKCIEDHNSSTPNFPGEKLAICHLLQSRLALQDRVSGYSIVSMQDKGNWICFQLCIMVFKWSELSHKSELIHMLSRHLCHSMVCQALEGVLTLHVGGLARFLHDNGQHICQMRHPT